MLGRLLYKLLVRWNWIKNDVIVFIFNLRPGIRIGKGVKITGSTLKLRPGGEIRIGDYSTLENTILDASNRKILIGDRCSFICSNIKVKYGGEVSIGSFSELLEGSVIQTYGGNITIGDHCSINAHTIIYGHGNTTIGDDVLIAGHCMIIPSNHIIDDVNKSIRVQGNVSKGINIKNNVWIGHGCSILDGITIKVGSIIAAGSVVNKDTKKNGIYAGIPSSLKKSRNQ